MFELEQLEVGEIGTAPADQTDYEHRWLIGPRAGKLEFWASDTGIDGQSPVDVDEPDRLVFEGEAAERHRRGHRDPELP
jgi:hypothetical protein